MDITAQLALRLFTRRSGKNAQLGQTISLPVTYLDQEGLRRGANATGQVSAAARRDAETRGGLTQLGCVYPTARRKKNRGLPLFFYSSLSGVQTGIPSGPSGGIPSPSVGSELLFVPALRYALLPEHSSSGFPLAPVCSWSLVGRRRHW